MLVLDDVAAILGVILDGHDVRLPDADTAHELVELDELLEDHAERAGLVVGADQLVDGVDLVDILPAAAPRIFQNGRQPGVGDDGVPVQRVVEVAQALADDAFRVRLHGQHDGLGRRNPQARDQARPEKFVVGAPPEGVVDAVGAL